jgi:TRIAD3 protein (E3 ubiquitin-protein ligase RNF216)
MDCPALLAIQVFVSFFYSSCPKCEFQAVLPPEEMIFRCPVEDCGFESCRKCGEEPHIPLKCEEVEKKHETKGRLKVEEAISAAKIRTCPRCAKKFVKETGCNKMTCACGAWVCYICRQEIPKHIGYGHFCRKPHCEHKKCSKCVLYTNAEEDDARAMREAGIRAAEAVREETSVRNDSSQVSIDVDSILKNPSPRDQRRAPQAGGVALPVMPPGVARRRRAQLIGPRV